MLFTSCSKDDNLIREGDETLTTFEKTALDEVTKIRNIDKDELDVQTLTIEGFEVPMVISKKNGDIYPVLVDSLGNIQMILKQEVNENEKGEKSYRHYVNNNYIGSYKKNANGELVEFSMPPKEEDLQETDYNFQARRLKEETCVGEHYRKMKELIKKDGDNQALCDGLNYLGLCDAAILTAAAIHCGLEH